MLESKRLILRNWQVADIEPFVSLNQDEEVMRYFPNILTRDQVLTMTNRIKDHFDLWGYGLYAAELKEEQRFVGFIGLSHPRFESSFTPCVEIGWRLSKDVWGRGLATEGAQLVLKRAFNDLKLKEIYSFTAIDNIGSYRVMEKIGMKKIGNFEHPNLEVGHKLRKHWIYHLTNPMLSL